MPRTIDNPILNSPFDEPAHQFRFDDQGITSEIVEARRVSSDFIPIAQPRKKGQRLQFETEAAWQSPYQTSSRPFAPPASGRIAVNVIKHHGDEVLEVFDFLGVVG